MSAIPDTDYLTDDLAAELLADAPWRRLAVLGDSLAAGVGDDSPGYPSGGWPATLARVLRQVHPQLAYLNVGERDRLTREVRATQFHRVLEFAPDLTVLICGGNDFLRRDFDLNSVAAQIDDMVGELRARGSDVVLFGLMDITTTGLVDPRYIATMNERLVALADANQMIAGRHGAIYVRMTEHPMASDPALYSGDRLHANGRGHAVLATATIRRLAERINHTG